MDKRPDYYQIDALSRGYYLETQAASYRCIYCGALFDKGLVYPVAGAQALADRAAALHVSRSHGGAFAALLAKGSAGLPEVQQKVLALLYDGKTDAEIAALLGGKSPSTIRNHRFALRKRESESRAFLALIRLLDERRPETPRFLEYPDAVAGMDERAMVSEKEAAAIETRYINVGPDSGMSLSGWPKKQKDKLVLLRRIAALFEKGRRYSETDVNAILGPVWPDHVAIRRYLIEYRFLDRKRDCSEYWLM